jgi:hydroxymethylpyrimidine pyrophosphatase-like HAD family hydrolase
MVMSIEAAIAQIPTKITVRGFERDLSAVGNRISQQFAAFVSVFPSNNWTFLNIVNTRTSKTEALRKLLNSQNILLDSVIAFGDDIPDLDMLKACGTPVVMANAFPEVKAACVYQTASNDEDGVVVVLEKMLAETG